jgi:hypothetical protein
MFMAVIDRDLLLTEVKFYLGYVDEFNTGPNALPDSVILSIAESVILEVGDDDLFYAEVKCKTIKKCAVQNKVLASINRGRGVRREESNKREVEWFQGSDPVAYWTDYINMLPELCSSFGYCELPSASAGGFYANISRPVVAPACPDYYKMSTVSPNDCDCNE